MFTRVATVGVATIALTAGGLVAATPALAATGTNQCTVNTSYNNNSVAIHCASRTDGNNQFRAVIRCTNGVTSTGPWRATGGSEYNYSSVGCASGTITNTYVDFRRVTSA